MIENPLRGANFLAPAYQMEMGFGCISRAEYFQQLKQGSVIGTYDGFGRFIIDSQKTACYAEDIREMSLLLASPESASAIDRYRLGEMKKGHLEIVFAPTAEKKLGASKIKFSSGGILGKALQHNLVLVDCNRDTYEILVPESVIGWLDSISYAENVGNESSYLYPTTGKQPLTHTEPRHQQLLEASIHPFEFLDDVMECSQPQLRASIKPA